MLCLVRLLGTRRPVFAILLDEKRTRIRGGGWHLVKRAIDPRGLLITTAVSSGLSLVAFPFLYFNIGSIDRLHPLIFYPLCLASGVLYVMATVKRRPDLSITRLGGGGALTAVIPACILPLAVAPTVRRLSMDERCQT